MVPLLPPPGPAAASTRLMSLLGPLGLYVDEDRNQSRDTGIRAISTDGSRFPVLVVPNDEERAIAEATAAVVLRPLVPTACGY